VPTQSQKNALGAVVATREVRDSFFSQFKA